MPNPDSSQPNHHQTQAWAQPNLAITRTKPNTMVVHRTHTLGKFVLCLKMLSLYTQWRTGRIVGLTWIVQPPRGGLYGPRGLYSHLPRGCTIYCTGLKGVKHGPQGGWGILAHFVKAIKVRNRTEGPIQTISKKRSEIWPDFWVWPDLYFDLSADIIQEVSLTPVTEVLTTWRIYIQIKFPSQTQWFLPPNHLQKNNRYFGGIFWWKNSMLWSVLEDRQKRDVT